MKKMFEKYLKKLRKLLRTVVSYVEKRRTICLKWFYRLVLPLSVLLFLWSAVFLAVNNSFSHRTFHIKVQRGSSAQEILRVLHDNGLARNEFNTKLAVRLGRYDRKMHTGEFIISSGMSLKRIYETLGEKHGLSLTSSKQVMIPEGYSLMEILEVLDKKGVVSSKAFHKYFEDYDPQFWKDRYTFLADNPLNGAVFFEGYLYPDTYIFAEDTTPRAVLDFMLSRFEKMIYPRLQEAVGTYNVHELLTLASIVEKEAVLKDEMPLIAGVYYNRLRIRMHLGACPTIKYALGNPRKKNLLYRDLEVVSPYNTYKNYDLPPSPICSPGLNAIDAIVNTPRTAYLYFFAKGDGTSVFSNTYEEHLRKQGRNPSFLYNIPQ